MAGKNIVITGGLGYVGGRLSKYFADKGFNVSAISRSKKVDYPGITVYNKKDVLEEKALAHLNIEAVIHLAATNEITCGNSPQESNEVNINGTIDWLEWSYENGVKQFIYFSTVHVYARPLIGTFDESSICLPNHPYSISHKSAEDYVLWYNTDFDLNTKIVRLSNSFGYPAFPTADRWTLFVNDICKQIAESNQFVIRSNIKQHRDFITLTEVCTAVDKLIHFQSNDQSLDANIYNLSKGKSQSLFEFASITKEVAEDYLGKDVGLIFDETKSQDANRIIISNQKLREIGWETSNKYTRDEIKETLAYFIKNI